MFGVGTSFVDAVAFGKPGTPTTISPTTDTTPTWTWTVSIGNPPNYKVSWETTDGEGADFAIVTTNSFTHTISLTEGTWVINVTAFGTNAEDASVSDNGSVVIELGGEPPQNLPNTSIGSSKPSDPTTSTTAFFTFSGTNSPTSFQCSLDDESFNICPSSNSKSYPGLSEGDHTFSVKAINAFGEDLSPATWSWTISLGEPVSTPTPTPTGTSPCGSDINHPRQVSSPVILSVDKIEGADLYRWELDGETFEVFTEIPQTKPLEEFKIGLHSWSVVGQKVILTGDDKGIHDISNYSDTCYIKVTVTTPLPPADQPPTDKPPTKPSFTPGVCQNFCAKLNTPDEIPPLDGITCICNPLQSENFTDIIDNILNFLFNIALVLSPIMVVIAGVLFITAAGKPEQLSKAKQILIWTAVGFGVILLSRGLITVLQRIIGF